MRRILHVDMDAFFAAVELLRRPELKGKPVIVGGRGDPTKRGVAATASYEARRFGVHSGMPLQTAYKLCPKAVFLPVDFDAYVAASEQIKRILRTFSPQLEDAGLDEAFLDISDINQSSEAIATAIKQRIAAETGLTCSIGIAPNKLLAKLASDMQKPDGLTILAEGDIESRVWPLAVRKLWGVGPKTEASLVRMGVRTIGELAAQPEERLIEEFGPSHGQHLYLAARGIDESPVITHWEPKSISRETTFEHDLGDWQALAKVLAGLARDVVEDMSGQDYRAKTVTVKLRFADFVTRTRATTLDEPTESLEVIRRAGFGCLNRIELVKKVRLLGLRVSGLDKKTAQARLEKKPEA